MATTKYRGSKCPKVSTDRMRRWVADTETWAVNVVEASMMAQESSECGDAEGLPRNDRHPEHGTVTERAGQILALIEAHEQEMLDLGPQSWAGVDGNFMLDFR